MILYYSPGACSLSDHIALHEAGMDFDLTKVDLKTHQLEDGRPFTSINPKGYVPALQLDDGELLTENVAILGWIADKHSALAPQGALGRTRLLEMLAFISTEIHKAFKPLFAKAGDAEKIKAKDLIATKLALIASQFKEPYLFGDRPSAADPYLFVMLSWAQHHGIEIPEKLVQFNKLMKSRPAVRQALEHEGLAA